MYKLFSWTSLLLCLFFCLFLVGLATTYINIKSTLIGYETGTLKSTEHTLLKKKNSLTLELTQTMEKSNLMELSKNRHGKTPEVLR